MLLFAWLVEETIPAFILGIYNDVWEALDPFTKNE